MNKPVIKIILAFNIDISQNLIEEYLYLPTLAVEAFEPYKAPEDDSMLLTLLQKGVYVVLSSLKNILRASYIPKRWRVVKVIYSLKDGKMPQMLYQNSIDLRA